MTCSFGARLSRKTTCLSHDWVLDQMLVCSAGSPRTDLCTGFWVSSPSANHTAVAAAVPVDTVPTVGHPRAGPDRSTRGRPQRNRSAVPWWRRRTVVAPARATAVGVAAAAWLARAGGRRVAWCPRAGAHGLLRRRRRRAEPPTQRGGGGAGGVAACQAETPSSPPPFKRGGGCR